MWFIFKGMSILRECERICSGSSFKREKNKRDLVYHKKQHASVRIRGRSRGVDKGAL